MGNLLVKARTRAGVTVIGAAVIALGAGTVATAAVLDNPPAEVVTDTEPVTTQPVSTTASGRPADTERVAAESPAVDTPAATVAAVTEPDAPAAEPTVDAPGPEESSAYDPAAPWTDSTGLTYVPAPPIPVEPLPGEGTEPD